MAKGRTLTTSRSERYLGSFSGHGAANTAPELREEDVWSVVDDDDRSVNGEWGSLLASTEGNSRSYGNYRSRRPPSPSSSDDHQVGGLSLAFDDASDTSSRRIVHHFRPHDGPRGRGHNIASSAPVNVPDWSKIYRVDSVESLHDSDDGLNDSELVPPHEYLARAYGRQMAANSVFEGVGRTLKGRDLSRVRDAVWSQTGFDG